MRPKKKTKKWLVVLLALLVLVAGFTVYATARMGFFGAKDQWQNFLLIGTDTRKDEVDAARSDTMMICSVNLGRGEVKLTSLARDMWVDIAGEEYGENKLNAAHRYGGPQLLMDTLNETFGLELKEYVSINFFGLIDVVDALGGVDIEISKSEAGVINKDVYNDFPNAQVTRVQGGVAHLSGVQALTLARTRRLDNDFGRTSRQRRLLSALLAEVKESSPGEFYSFAKTCFEHTSTNISFDRMLELGGTLLRSGLDGFQELSLPSKGNYRSVTKNGSSALAFDAEQVAQELHAFIYGE